jgi:hypothetical protein
MKSTAARELAERLGYRFEKVRSEDRYIVRDFHRDIRIAHGLTYTGLVEWLEQARRKADRERERFVGAPSRVEMKSAPAWEPPDSTIPNWAKVVFWVVVVLVVFFVLGMASTGGSNYRYDPGPLPWEAGG